MCVDYVVQKVWSINCCQFAFFTTFSLSQLGVRWFAEQGRHGAGPSRSKLCVALLARGASSVLLRLCAERMWFWITCVWMETFLQRWHGYLWRFWTMTAEFIVLSLSCMHSLLQKFQELKRMWKALSKPIWGASPTSAASIEKTLLTWNTCAFKRNCTWTATPTSVITVEMASAT